MTVDTEKSTGYITRAAAIESLYKVINSGIISEDLADELAEIANCIEAEETHNVFLWGAEGDATELFVAYRDDLWTDELHQKMDAIYEKYKIK